ETYQSRLQLLTALLKRDQIFDPKHVSELLDFELDTAIACYKSSISRADMEDLTLRQAQIQKLESKITLYRLRYFTQIDRDDLRAQWYIDNGLKQQLRDNSLSLEMRCKLQL